MNVRILYFAGVRDALGKSEEELDLPGSVSTVGALAAHLEQLHPALSGRLRAVRFAVNEEFAESDAALATGDTIAVIPPVAGG